jgi:hypothetical protein
MSIHLTEEFESIDEDFFVRDISHTLKNAKQIPLILSSVMGSLYQIMNNKIETAILIFTATEVDAIPLRCELIPMSKNNAIKSIPVIPANGSQFKSTSASLLKESPYTKNPKISAVK